MDYVAQWSERTGIAVKRIVPWLGVREAKFDDWKQRYGRVNKHNGKVPRTMLTLQRLGGGQTLNAIVKDVLSCSRELLPDNQRLREGTLSETSGAYSDARTRLKLETVEFFANRVCVIR